MIKELYIDYSKFDRGSELICYEINFIPNRITSLSVNLVYEDKCDNYFDRYIESFTRESFINLCKTLLK